MANAYVGDKPYIFISYAHKDKKEVLRYIDALEKHGFLVWFDRGVEAGSEWPEYIAQRLAGSMCVLSFISENFVDSTNCKQELTLAQELKKQQLNVYLKNMTKDDLPMGVRMQVTLNQAIRCDDFETDAEFIKELCSARLIAECRKKAEAQTAKSDVKPRINRTPSYQIDPEKPKPAPAKYTSNAEKSAAELYLDEMNARRAAQGKKAESSNKIIKEELTEIEGPDEIRKNKRRALLDKKAKTYGRLSSVIMLLYIPISIFAMNFTFDMGYGVIKKILFMTLPLVALTLIISIAFFGPLKRKYEKYKINNDALTDDAAMVVLCWGFLSVIISAFAGAYYLNADMNYLLRLLISLGLNILPAIISFFISCIFMF